MWQNMSSFANTYNIILGWPAIEINFNMGLVSLLDPCRHPDVLTILAVYIGVLCVETSHVEVLQVLFLFFKSHCLNHCNLLLLFACSLLSSLLAFDLFLTQNGRKLCSTSISRRISLWLRWSSTFRWYLGMSYLGYLSFISNLLLVALIHDIGFARCSFYCDPFL